MAEIDEAWWLALSVADRVGLVTEQSQEADGSKQDNGGVAGLDFVGTIMAHTPDGFFEDQ